MLAKYFVIFLINSPFVLPLKYPELHRDTGNLGDVYNGARGSQPYKWMEDKRNQSQVEEHLRKQFDLTRAYYKECKNHGKYEEVLKNASKTPRYGDAWKLGSRYFYTKSEDPEMPAFWYVQEGRSDYHEPRRLNVVEAFVSFDGLFYATYDEQFNEIRVFNITGELEVPIDSVKLDSLQESLHNSEFDWLDDSSGFFYVAKKKFDRNEEEVDSHYVKFHKIGSISSKKDQALVKPTDEKFCVKDASCVIEQIVSTNDGMYLFVVSYSKVGDNVSYFYNLVKLDKASLKDSRVIPIKHGQVLEDYNQQLYIVAHKNSKVYFINEMEKPHRISEVEIIPVPSPVPKEEEGVRVKWRTVMMVEKDEEIDNALGVDVDKMLLSIRHGGNFQNSSVELRGLQNGKLIREFPLKYQEKLWFSGRLGESEVLFISSVLEGQMTEIYAFNASSPKSSWRPFKTQKFKMEMEELNYLSSVPSRNGNTISILHKKGFKKQWSSPGFIFLDTEKQFETAHLSLVENFDAVIAIHEKLEHPYPHEDKPFFSEMVEMDENVRNVIDIAEAMIKRGYTTNSKLYLAGYAKDAALAANVVNRRPDLFAALFISRTTPNFNPFEELTLCPDGHYGNWCKDINKAIFPLINLVSPLQHIGQVVGNGTTPHPAVLVNIDPEFGKNPGVKSDIFGLLYLAELQHRVGSKVTNTVPFLLNLNFETGSDYKYQGKFTDWANYLCFLEKSTGLYLSKF